MNIVEDKFMVLFHGSWYGISKIEDFACMFVKERVLAGAFFLNISIVWMQCSNQAKSSL